MLPKYEVDIIWRQMCTHLYDVLWHHYATVNNHRQIKHGLFRIGRSSTSIAYISKASIQKDDSDITHVQTFGILSID